MEVKGANALEAGTLKERGCKYKHRSSSVDAGTNKKYEVDSANAGTQVIEPPECCVWEFPTGKL